MANSSEGKLYSPALLSLATELAAFPLHANFDLRASERSRTCGSTIEIGIGSGPDGNISAVGMQISACAVGQASAALLAKNAVGRSGQELIAAYRSIEDWLARNGDLPDWPGFTALEPAHGFSGRHEALLLPWKAASSALCKAKAAS